jgi:hypothetical protein
MVAAGLGAVVAASSPGLSIAERIGAPCAVVLTTAIAYGAVFVILRGLAKASRVVSIIYGYAFMLGGLVSLFALPILARTEDLTLDLSNFSAAMQIGSFAAMCLAAVWASAVAIETERNAA